MERRQYGKEHHMEMDNLEKMRKVMTNTANTVQKGHGRTDVGHVSTRDR